MVHVTHQKAISSVEVMVSAWDSKVKKYTVMGKMAIAPSAKAIAQPMLTALSMSKILGSHEIQVNREGDGT
jgi:hypothetical protein